MWSDEYMSVDQTFWLSARERFLKRVTRISRELNERKRTNSHHRQLIELRLLSRPY